MNQIDMDYNIVLIGFMGTGKTTVSEYLKEEYGMDLVDMDREIVDQEKMSIPEIFSTYGEEYFRNLETNLLITMQQKRNTVISCGGGAALREKNVKEMKKNGRVVLLTASPEIILKRVKDNDDRPILRGRKTVEGIAELMEQRQGKYEAAADIIIHTDNKKVPVICEEMIESLKGMDKE